MKNLNIFFLLYFFSILTVWGDTIIIEGVIVNLKFCHDVNSPRFINEYNSYIENYNLSNTDFNAIEILLKQDEGVFVKYCIIIQNHKMTLLKSLLTDNNVLHLFTDENHVLYHLGNLVQSFPKLVDDINLEIDLLKQNISENDKWTNSWITYHIIEYKELADAKYFIIRFESSYNSLGGILYAIDINGEIAEKNSLTENISESILYYCKFLSYGKMILFRSTGVFGLDTEISIISILAIPDNTDISSY